LEYIPFTIAAPEEILPVQAATETPTHWFFKGFDRDSFDRFLDALDMPAGFKEQMLDPSALRIVEDGVDLIPPREVLISLPRGARNRIYRHIAAFPENTTAFTFVPSKSLEDRFSKGGVSPETTSLFKKMSCDYGSYLIFSGMSVLLSSMPKIEDRVRVLQVLTEQKSLLVRLRINAQTDVRALDRYWAKGLWTTDLRALLQSLTSLPNEISLSLIEMLPPLPASLINTFPKAQDPAKGPPVNRDCHWTSLNFFNETPDDRCSDPGFFREKLQNDYTRVAAQPHYGDIILLEKPDRSVIHSAVFLADNIVYTKNGGSPSSPWILSTLPDMMERYSFHVAPNQALIVSYYRKNAK
jgi:hypothetical protein